MFRCLQGLDLGDAVGHGAEDVPPGSQVIGGNSLGAEDFEQQLREGLSRTKEQQSYDTERKGSNCS